MACAPGGGAVTHDIVDLTGAEGDEEQARGTSTSRRRGGPYAV
jgi:hypothetical protein